MKYKIAAFFEGRNGMDELSKIILWPSLILMLISGFIGIQWLSAVLYGISIGGVVYSYMRVFSRKLDQRHGENEAYLRWKNRLKSRWQQRRTHAFFRCPKCKTTLRVPRGKGKISVTCRCCGEKFIKKT